MHALGFTSPNRKAYLRVHVHVHARVRVGICLVFPLACCVYSIQMDDAARSSRRCTKDSVRTVFDSPDFASSQSRIHTRVRSLLRGVCAA